MPPKFSTFLGKVKAKEEKAKRASEGDCLLINSYTLRFNKQIFGPSFLDEP